MFSTAEAAHLLAVASRAANVSCSGCVDAPHGPVWMPFSWQRRGRSGRSLTHSSLTVVLNLSEIIPLSTCELFLVSTLKHDGSIPSCTGVLATKSWTDCSQEFFFNPHTLVVFPECILSRCCFVNSVLRLRRRFPSHDSPMAAMFVQVFNSEPQILPNPK